MNANGHNETPPTRREGRIFSRWLIGVGVVWMAGGIVFGPYAVGFLLGGVVAQLVGFAVYPRRRRVLVVLTGLALGCWWIYAFALFGHEWLFGTPPEPPPPVDDSSP